MSSAIVPAKHPLTVKRSRIAQSSFTLVEQPGEFKWIDKGLLKRDPAYQRDPVQRKVERIAAQWSWMACGALSVALRGKEAYVYDGWHRREASMRLDAITNLPCIAFRVADLVQEAGGFLQANSNRYPISAMQRFKAALVTKDEASVRAKQLIADAGYSPGKNTKSPNGFSPISSLVDSLATCPELTERIWSLLVEVAHGEQINQRMLSSVLYIERALERKGRGESLTRKPWRERLIGFGAMGIIAAAGRASAYYSRGGEKIWAQGVVDALNKSVKIRLTLSDEAESE